MLEVARARHRDSPKGFACFLSHHKQACAAEARLVKQQLESMLHAKVFLGKCAALSSSSPPPYFSQTPSLGMFQPDELEAARDRHRDSPKGFACFLSHHKPTCAAEARLVKQQLESMLDAKVFSGKRAAPALQFPSIRH